MTLHYNLTAGITEASYKSGRLGQESDPVVTDTTVSMTAPVLLNFVYWVLEQAEADGISTLFFLARDGYILKLIGDKLAQAYFPTIKCKYFYCSRGASGDALFSGYAVQEGLNKPGTAIVDTGWLGSIQAAIGRDDIIGYYFGLYSTGYQNCGEYRAYMFSPKARWWWSFGFNANVFECLCGANHGMTVGYEKVGDWIVPRLKYYEPAWHTELQIRVIQDYVRNFIAQGPIRGEVPLDAALVRKMLMKFIRKPTEAQASVYGAILFDHDKEERRLYPLAEKVDVSLIKGNLFFYRIFGRFFGRFFEIKKKRPLYWIEGAALLSGYSLGIEIYLVNLGKFLKTQNLKSQIRSKKNVDLSHTKI